MENIPAQRTRNNLLFAEFNPCCKAVNTQWSNNEKLIRSSRIMRNTKNKFSYIQINLMFLQNFDMRTPPPPKQGFFLTNSNVSSPKKRNKFYSSFTLILKTLGNDTPKQDHIKHILIDYKNEVSCRLFE